MAPTAEIPRKLYELGHMLHGDSDARMSPRRMEKMSEANELWKLGDRGELAVRVEACESYIQDLAASSDEDTWKVLFAMTGIRSQQPLRVRIVGLISHHLLSTGWERILHHELVVSSGACGFKMLQQARVALHGLIEDGFLKSGDAGRGYMFTPKLQNLLGGDCSGGTTALDPKKELPRISKVTAGKHSSPESDEHSARQMAAVMSIRLLPEPEPQPASGAQVPLARSIAKAASWWEGAFLSEQHPAPILLVAGPSGSGRSYFAQSIVEAANTYQRLRIVASDSTSLRKSMKKLKCNLNHSQNHAVIVLDDVQNLFAGGPAFSSAKLSRIQAEALEVAELGVAASDETFPCDHLLIIACVEADTKSESEVRKTLRGKGFTPRFLARCQLVTLPPPDDSLLRHCLNREMWLAREQLQAAGIEEISGQAIAPLLEDAAEMAAGFHGTAIALRNFIAANHASAAPPTFEEHRQQTDADLARIDAELAEMDFGGLEEE